MSVLELVSYGLTGLTAMLVIALCLELTLVGSRRHRKPSCDLFDHAHSINTSTGRYAGEYFVRLREHSSGCEVSHSAEKDCERNVTES